MFVALVGSLRSIEGDGSIKTEKKMMLEMEFGQLKELLFF